MKIEAVLPLTVDEVLCTICKEEPAEMRAIYDKTEQIYFCRECFDLKYKPSLCFWRRRLEKIEAAQALLMEHYEKCKTAKEATDATSKL